MIDELNELTVEHRGALAEVTLNRPRTLNALNDVMRAKLMANLPKFARNPDVYAVIMRSNNPRAFSAGGDVRELIALCKSDGSATAAAESLRFEYTMNWTLECFSKPTVSLIDGMVMGSGVGLVQYGTHRVAGERYQFAMPENAIGLFPDVGMCCALSKMPGWIGYYLGLTGHSIGRATALRVGLATHVIDAEHYGTITAGLEAADTVDPLLDNLHQDPGDDPLMAHQEAISEAFSQPTLAQIFSALAKRAGRGGSEGEWCAGVLADLEARSPLSLALTLRHLNACRELGLRDTLTGDFRIAVRCLQGADFHEGVRALLIDKDNAPKWQHATINEVSDAEVDAYFAALGDRELLLPTRAEMQASRI